MNCRYCGAELPPGAMFCGECGRATSAPEEAAAPSSAPVAAAPPLVEPPYAALIAPMPVAFSAADAASGDPVDHVAPALPPIASGYTKCAC